MATTKNKQITNRQMMAQLAEQVAQVNKKLERLGAIDEAFNRVERALIALEAGLGGDDDKGGDLIPNGGDNRGDNLPNAGNANNGGDFPWDLPPNAGFDLPPNACDDLPFDDDDEYIYMMEQDEYCHHHQYYAMMAAQGLSRAYLQPSTNYKDGLADILDYPTTHYK